MRQKLFCGVNGLAMGFLAASMVQAASLDPGLTQGGGGGVFDGLPLSMISINDSMLSNTPMLTSPSAFRFDGLVFQEPGMGNSNSETLGHLIDASSKLGYGTYVIYDRLAFYTIVIVIPGYTGTGDERWTYGNGAGEVPLPTYVSDWVAQSGVRGPQVPPAMAEENDPVAAFDFAPIPEPHSLVGLLVGLGYVALRRPR